MQKPSHIPSLQWHAALAQAGAICEAVRAAGGKPIDAIRVYGIPDANSFSGDWEKAHDAIATAVCSSSREH